MIINKCETCKHWKAWDPKGWGSVFDAAFPRDPYKYESELTEEANNLKWGYTPHVCESPKIIFHQRPEIDGAALFDGSEYRATFLTSPEFGCVQWKPNDSGNV